MTDPTFVDAGKFSGASNSVPVTVPAGVTADDLLIVGYVHSGAGTFTPPTGWNYIGSGPVSNPNTTEIAHFLYKDLVPGDASTVHNFAQTGTSPQAALVAILAKDVDKTQLDDFDAWGTPSSTSHDAPVVSVTDARASLVIELTRGTVAGVPSFTAPAGYTIVNQVGASGSGKVAAAAAAKATPHQPAGGGSWGLNYAMFGIELTIGIKGKASSGGGSGTGINEVKNLNDPTNDFLLEATVNSDGSATSGWRDRVVLAWKAVAGVAAKTFTLNEYFEPRVYPAKSNTVPFRVFAGRTPTEKAARDNTVPLIQIYDDPTTRTDVFGVLPDGTVSKSGQVLAPLFRLPTGVTWASYAGDKSKLVGVVVLQGTTILGQWNGSAFV